MRTKRLLLHEDLTNAQILSYEKIDEVIMMYKQPKSRVTSSLLGSSRILELKWSELKGLKEEASFLAFKYLTEDIYEDAKKDIFSVACVDLFAYDSYEMSRLVKRLLLDEMVKIVRVVLIASSLSESAGHQVSVMMPSGTRLIWDHMAMSNSEVRTTSGSSFKSLIDRLEPIYIRESAFFGLQCWIKRVTLSLLYLCGIRSIVRMRDRLSFGLLAWKTSMPIGHDSETDVCLDSVLPIDAERNNVLVISKTPLTKQAVASIRRKGYKSIKTYGTSLFRKTTPSGLTYVCKSIYRSIRSLPKHISYSGLVPIEHILRMGYCFDRWNSLILSYKLDSLVSNNDLGLDCIVRNIVVSSDQVKTLFYFDSAITDETLITGVPDSLIADRSFCSFDFVYFRMPYQVHSFKSSMNQAKSMEVSGCLRIVNRKAGFSAVKTIAFFPCSYSNATRSSRKDLNNFFLAINELTQEMGSVIKALIKVKGTWDSYRDCMDGDELRRLQDSEHIHIYDNNSSYIDVISKSDAVVSMAFTSPTIDAISNGIPAAFFDSSRSYPESCFSSFNGIYLYSYDNLKRFVETVVLNKSSIDQKSTLVRAGIIDESLSPGIERIRSRLQQIQARKLCS